MKSKLLIAIAIFSISYANAQSYFGYLNDNYAGVHSVLNNPANIVDSRYRADINLFSFSALATNDYYGVKFFDILKSDYNFEKDAKQYPTNSNNFLLNFDVLGPSFMFNLNKKSSIALFTRVRGISHLSNINGSTLNDVQDGNNASYQVNNQNFSIASNSWGELGLSYARILMDKGQHFLKGGFSAKYLVGVYSGYAKANNINMAFNYTGNSNTSTYTSSGSLEVGNLTSLDNFDDPTDNIGTGFGADLGFTYEYRPDYGKYQYTNKEGGKSYHKDQNKYKFRLGVSVTDIGAISYKDAIVSVYNVNTTYTDAQYNANSNFNNLYTIVNQTKSLKFKLPTAIHLNADWRMNKRFYLNLNSDFSAVAAADKNSSYINNNVSVTPRFESKWLSVYTPISYLEYSGLQAGFGFRAGPLFVGSGSIISAMLSETKAIDAHLGLKVPIYQNKIKDIDFDGIKDKDDNCPDVAGPVENKGCPWGDADNDGLTDNLDKCPKEFGPTENNGCPWTDKDGDNVLDKDDSCPDVVGAVENKGCPWGDEDKDGVTDNLDNCPTLFGEKVNNGCPYTDKDGDNVLDKDDKCPDVVGTIENNGCPVIDTKVIKKLNDYSKSVLFDTGKATISANYYATLDAMTEIMKEYETTNFSIEGHTDNVGKPESNVELSAERALAIKTYLISKGINENRLNSQGFGAAKPIASNKTAAGKTVNRRVEIKVIE
jgi:outer membrane protein OmpA-like peptidoglycan-associated protein